MTLVPTESVVEPISESDLLSMVTRLPTSVRKLVADKEAMMSRCAELERQLAQEKEARLVLQQKYGELQRQQAVLAAENLHL